MPPELPTRIEPTLLDSIDPPTADLIAQLPAAAQALERSLHPDTASSLRELVAMMNCYYSNLIEGHHTRPRDIERALSDDFDADRTRRNLQLEARAHIRVQAEVDRRAAKGKLDEPSSLDFIRWLHREFYRDAPSEFLEFEGAKVVPGEWRTRDNQVGQHVPPGHARVPEFMEYFSQRYRLEPLGDASRLVALAAAHHRFNFIHPFLDGNGRVSRLMSHAMCFKAGIGAHGLWSISRGLARGLAGGLEGRAEYKRMMALTDAPREGDLDGRGNLSRRRLGEFVHWFLGVCVDQVKYMASLFELEHLRPRLARWADQQPVKRGAARLLDEVARRGSIDRGEAAAITKSPERTARTLLADLQKRGILASRTPKGPVSLRFTLDNADVLLPKLFADG
jgi:Fic family protein